RNSMVFSFFIAKYRTLCVRLSVHVLYQLRETRRIRAVRQRLLFPTLSLLSLHITYNVSSVPNFLESSARYCWTSSTNRYAYSTPCPLICLDDNFFLYSHRWSLLCFWCTCLCADNSRANRYCDVALHGN